MDRLLRAAVLSLIISIGSGCTPKGGAVVEPSGTASDNGAATGASDSTSSEAAESSTVTSAPAPAAISIEVQVLQDQARNMLNMTETRWVKRWLGATTLLPSVETRKLYYDRDAEKVYTETQAGRFPPEQKEKLVERERDGRFYYFTRYGTPIAYARPYDILGKFGLTVDKGTKVADWGYGSIGQLRLLAMIGAEVCGIEVNPEYLALYGYPGDQGVINGPGGLRGKLRIVHGYFPGDESVVEQIGTGYDLFISKNTLKRGYIHPQREADPRYLLNLGASDEAYVQTVYDLLKPGGYFMVYNLCPAPSKPDEEFKPMTDGHFPFDRALCETIGFEVLAFDLDDSNAAREMAKRLGWDNPEMGGAMDVENDLFGMYTLLKKKG